MQQDKTLNAVGLSSSLVANHKKGYPALKLLSGRVINVQSQFSGQVGGDGRVTTYCTTGARGVTSLHKTWQLTEQQKVKKRTPIITAGNSRNAALNQNFFLLVSAFPILSPRCWCSSLATCTSRTAPPPSRQSSRSCWFRAGYSTSCAPATWSPGSPSSTSRPWPRTCTSSGGTWTTKDREERGRSRRCGAEIVASIIPYPLSCFAGRHCGTVSHRRLPRTPDHTLGRP